MADTQSLHRIPQALLDSLPTLPAGLYPLPLSAFEKYLIWDESPAQPMNSFIELHFLDPLQVNVMEDAIAAAMKVHPMLVSTIEERDGELFWVHRPDYRHTMDVEMRRSSDGDDRPVAIDLRRQPGIRFWYSQDDHGRSRVLIQLHHAAADGVGLRRFLIDAMTLYAQATSPDSVDSTLRPPWNKVDLELLRRRADFSDSFGGPPSQPLSGWQRIRNARFFHFQLPRPLRGSSGKRRTDSIRSVSMPGQLEASEPVDSTAVEPTLNTLPGSQPLEHLAFDRSTSEAILEKSRIAEIGVNELSLALLFETCSLWNQQHGDRSPSNRLRLLMPYDLRSRIDLRMTATNRLSFSFLGRAQADCHNLPELIKSIADEIQAMKASHLPLDFLAALEGAAKYPRLMRWAMRRSRNMATAVLTYAGDISRGMQKYFPERDGARIVGDARLDKILAAPPTRDNTHISMGLCINWGQLCISAAWNRDGFTRQQCREFLQLYYSRWLNWLK